jgi:LEA14-like dessication related protein
MRALLRAAPALVALWLGAACAPHLEKPELSVASVQLVSATIFEQHLKVRLHVHNPNDRALPIKGIEYRMEVMEQQAAIGQSDASFVVPTLGDAEFDMSVTTNLAGTLLQLLSRGSNALAQEVPYRLSGKVELSEGWLRSIPFDQRGTFKLQ